MTRPLTPEQKEKYRKMDEQLKEAALFAKKLQAMIKQSPIYQNPVVKSIRAALGVVNSDVLKLKPFNH